MNKDNSEKTLIEIYDYIEINQLKELVKLLAPKQQEAVYAKFGENLDKHISWNNQIAIINGGNLKNANGILFAVIYLVFSGALLISNVASFRFLQLTVFKYLTIGVLGLFTVILFIAFVKKKPSNVNHSE